MTVDRIAALHQRVTVPNIRADHWVTEWAAECRALRAQIEQLELQLARAIRQQADDRYELECRLVPARPGPLGWGG